MYATMENRLPIMDRMLDLGCDINVKNRERYTTLHLGSMYSREDTIKMLLNRKADPTAAGGVSLSTHTRLSFCGMRLKLECFPLLQPKNQSCVHLVCSRPTSQALQILRSLMSVAPKNTRVTPDNVSSASIVGISPRKWGRLSPLSGCRGWNYARISTGTDGGTPREGAKWSRERELS